LIVVARKGKQAQTGAGTIGVAVSGW